MKKKKIANFAPLKGQGSLWQDVPVLFQELFFSIIATSQFFVQVCFFFSFLRAYLYLPHFSFSFLFPFITFAGLRKYRISVYIIIAVVILNSVLVTIPRVNTLTHTST